jgi:hypothetical protein
MDVTALHDYFLKLNDREFKLVLKGLALVAGLKVMVAPEERGLAATINKNLLAQRVAVLNEQLRVAQGALTRAEETEASNEGEDSTS